MSGVGHGKVRTRVLLVGVGGQGVVTAAEVLGLALREASVPVTVGQLHGMAQRGGSVESTVVIGAGATAFVGSGEADIVVGFEPLETVRAIPRMHAETQVLFNLGRIAPFLLAQSGQPYPELEGLERQVREVTPRVRQVDGPQIVGAVGEPRTLNIVMLGALVGLAALPVSADALERAVVQRYGTKNRAVNLRALQQGVAATSAGDRGPVHVEQNGAVQSENHDRTVGR